MSTIGTTLKEPRVFAHDAIALDDLCGATNGILTLTVAPPATPGTGYTAGPTTYATTSDSEFGSGATVSVTVIGGGGAVTAFTLVDAGEFYEAGDTLTLVGGGSGDNCTIVIATVGCTTWALGDPITRMPNNFNTVPYWNEKTAYTYSTSIPSGPFQTPGPGVAIYVGVTMDITVINEATTEVEYIGVNAGSFLPVSVLSVVEQSAGNLNDILALF
jgi:hypothetical protein